MATSVSDGNLTQSAVDIISDIVKEVPRKALKKEKKNPSKIVYLFITPNQFSNIARYIYGAQYLLIAVGLVGTALCIRTFYRARLKDCLSITLFNLAISNLCYLIIEAVIIAIDVKSIIVIDLHYSAIDNTFSYFNTIFGVDPDDLKELLSKASLTFFYASANLIGFLVIERSLCVLRPGRFKNVFTRWPTVSLVSVIWAYSLVNAITQFATVRLQEKCDESLKMPVIVMEPAKSQINSCVTGYWHYMNKTIFPIFSGVVLVLGLMVLMYGLLRDVHLQRRTWNRPEKSLNFSGQDKTAGNENKTKKAPDDITKEKQVIAQVAILAALLLSLNLFPVIQLIIRSFGLNLTRENLKYLWYLYKEINDSVKIIIFSVNFCVYFKYNHRFRDKCFQQKLECVRALAG